jgi:hypothetical protein
MGGQSGGRVEVTNYSLDGKKRRRNSLLRMFSVGIGFEATAKRPNRTSSSRWTKMSGEDYAGNRFMRKLIDLSGLKYARDQIRVSEIRPAFAREIMAFF